MGEINQLKYNFENLTLLTEILFFHLILKLNYFGVPIKKKKPYKIYFCIFSQVLILRHNYFNN